MMTERSMIIRLSCEDIVKMFQMWARQLQQISAAQARANRRPQPQQSNATEEIVLDGPAVTSEVNCNYS